MKIGLLTILFLAQLLAGFSAEFEQFKKENQQGFNKFKTNLDSDFRNYKKILNSEYREFKKEIFKNWGDYKTSSAKVWVEYSKDKQIRKIVDFEKNEIKIELISKSSDKKMAERILYKEAIKTRKGSFFFFANTVTQGRGNCFICSAIDLIIAAVLFLINLSLPQRY